MDLNKNLGRALILLAGALFATNAWAATVIGKLDSVGTGDTITIYAVLPNGQPLAQQVLLGMDTFTRTGGTDTSSLIGGPNGFLAFCLEPFEEARINNTYTYNVDLLPNAANSSISGGIGAIRAIQIGELFGQFAPTLSASMSALQASALQVAIWEIVGEPINSVFNLASGNMFFTTPRIVRFQQCDEPRAELSDLCQQRQRQRRPGAGADGADQ